MDTAGRQGSAFTGRPEGSAGASVAESAAPFAQVGSLAAERSSAGGFAVSLRGALGQAPLVGAGLVVAVLGSPAVAWAWFVACRLAYVLFVGCSLRAESTRGALSRRGGPEAAWRRFRDRASRVMVGDAVALGALCIVTRGSLAAPGPEWLAPLAGLVLIGIGVGVKLWATASLDEGTFYWRDFFLPAEQRNFVAAGPYRWMSNPMYTVGYAHAYGFALLLGSLSGLAAAALAQAAILLLAFLVERPHVRRREC